MCSGKELSEIIGTEEENEEEVMEEKKIRGKREDMELKGSGYSLVINRGRKVFWKIDKGE